MVSHAVNVLQRVREVATVTDPMMPDIDRARLLLETIGWDDVSVERVSGGTVNATFRLERGDEIFYLRIGPGVGEVEAGPSWFTGSGLRREQQAIELWSGHAQYFPRTIHADFSREVIAADWVIQTAVPGRPWSEVQSRLSHEESASLWSELGTLTAQLHAYVGEEFGPPEVGMGTSTWGELVRWDATGLLTDAHKFNLPTERFQELCDLVDERIDLLDEIADARLIHSDLGPRHVMVARDDDGGVRITGLIDMEFARFADAYSESIFVTQSLQTQPDPMFDLFLETYGADKPDFDSRARLELYQLTALGWWVTDAVRRMRDSEAQQALNAMTVRLHEAMRM